MMGDNRVSDRQLCRRLRRLQAKEIVEKKEGGLEAQVLQGGKNFSGGQKQRLTIARALAARPSIVLLDDSASALDLSTEAALRKALRGRPGSPTLLVVSQRASSVLSADQILVLDDGVLVGVGTHETLLTESEVYGKFMIPSFPERRRAMNKSNRHNGLAKRIWKELKPLWWAILLSFICAFVTVIFDVEYPGSHRTGSGLLQEPAGWILIG